MKICLKCNIEKEITDFHKDRVGIKGCRARCKVCELSQKRLKYQQNREIEKIRGKKWRDDNPDKVKAMRRKAYPRRKLWMKNKYKEDVNYREKIIANVQSYRDDPKNKLKRRESSRIAAIKYRSNPKNRIVLNLRRKMLLCLEGKRKADYSLKLIGCTKEDLIIHLQNQFKGEMSWENYGLLGWVIDHIIPCCSFDLSKAEEQRKCFHYTNLQPMWFKENSAKAAKDKLMKWQGAGIAPEVITFPPN